MGKGKWSRWGRGSCEGWSLDIGYALRGQVALNHDRSWRASVNATELGTWKTREEAMQAVETRITHEVQLILEDWSLWQKAIATRSGKKDSSTPGHPD